MRLDRQELRDRLERDVFDVLVIGGGITGAGVALDGAARGLRVGLVERCDFASGTSSGSTKLVHGGLRYLPQLDVRLVREALVERERLYRIAPYLVEPLPFLLPMYRDDRRPLGLRWVPPPGWARSAYLRAGLWTYDLLAGRSRSGRHRRVPPDEVARWAPLLRQRGLFDAYAYYDAQTDDARLVINVVLTAVAHGAVVCNYCEVVGFEQSRGRLSAAVVRDHATGESFTVRARVFVNATGIHGEIVERMTGSPPGVRIFPSKGVHLVLPRETAQVEGGAVVLPETCDGRLLFVVPFGPRVIVGTTDTGSGPLDAPRADDADVDYLLEHVNRYWSRPLSRAEVVSVFAGYRPLIHRGSGRSSAELSRSHVLLEYPNGLVSILGGKLTTYRRMAEETVDRVAARLGRPRVRVTGRLPLIGTPGLEEVRAGMEHLAEAPGLAERLPALIRAYGVRAQAVLELVTLDPALGRPLVPGLPPLAAQVVYACRYELAQTLADVLERRTWLTFADWDHGLPAADMVSRIVAAELGWDEEKRQREVDRYRERVRALFGAERGIADRLSAPVWPGHPLAE